MSLPFVHHRNAYIIDSPWALALTWRHILGLDLGTIGIEIRADIGVAHAAARSPTSIRQINLNSPQKYARAHENVLARARI
jgi:hypothetical protein